MKNRPKLWQCTRILLNKVFFWAFPVFVLGSIPIGAHLLAIVLNHDPHKQAEFAQTFSRAIIENAYLYAFIVAMTAFTDTLLERDCLEKNNAAMAFVFISFVAGFLNFVTQLDGAFKVTELQPILYIIAWGLPILTVVAYGFYKLPFLYGAAKADWEVCLKPQQGNTISGHQEALMQDNAQPLASNVPE